MARTETDFAILALMLLRIHVYHQILFTETPEAQLQASDFLLKNSSFLTGIEHEEVEAIYSKMTKRLEERDWVNSLKPDEHEEELGAKNPFGY